MSSSWPHHSASFHYNSLTFKSPSQILTDSNHRGAFQHKWFIRYSCSSSSRDSVWSQCSLLMQQRREGELGLSDQSLSLLIMRGLPCLTSLLVSLPCAKQMSSAADNKLHHCTLMKFIITGGGEEEWNGSFFNDLYTIVNVQMTNVSTSIQYLKFEIHWNLFRTGYRLKKKMERENGNRYVTLDHKTSHKV